MLWIDRDAAARRVGIPHDVGQSREGPHLFELGTPSPSASVAVDSSKMQVSHRRLVGRSGSSRLLLVADRLHQSVTGGNLEHHHVLVLVDAVRASGTATAKDRRDSMKFETSAVAPDRAASFVCFFRRHGASGHASITPV